MITASGSASNENPSETSKGVGRDRLIRKQLEGLKEQIDTSLPGSAEQEAAEARMVTLV